MASSFARTAIGRLTFAASPSPRCKVHAAQVASALREPVRALDRGSASLAKLCLCLARSSDGAVFRDALARFVSCEEDACALPAIHALTDLLLASDPGERAVDSCGNGEMLATLGRRTAQALTRAEAVKQQPLAADACAAAEAVARTCSVLEGLAPDRPGVEGARAAVRLEASACRSRRDRLGLDRM